VFLSTVDRPAPGEQVTEAGVRTLSRAIANQPPQAVRLRCPGDAMGQIVTLRTMELVVVAGAPAGGKSTLAANMAMGMRVPLLYCAQDSPASSSLG